jgi:hypothetical protein
MAIKHLLSLEHFFNKKHTRQMFTFMDLTIPSNGHFLFQISVKLQQFERYSTQTNMTSHSFIQFMHLKGGADCPPTPGSPLGRRDVMPPATPSPPPYTHKMHHPSDNIPIKSLGVLQLEYCTCLNLAYIIKAHEILVHKGGFHTQLTWTTDTHEFITDTYAYS